MAVIELVVFTASDALLSQADVLKEALGKVVASQGCRQAHHGIQSEDGKTGYLVIVWDNYEDHAALIESAGYPALVTALKKGIKPDTSFAMQHVLINNAEYVRAIEAPNTEIVIGTLHPGKNMDDALARFGELAAEINKASVAWDPVVLGVSKENSENFVAFLGWDSVQAHVDTVAPDNFQKMIANVREHVDLNIKHVPLIKYSP